MTPPDTRYLFRQTDDAWSRAFELAVTPFVAFGVGYLMDRVLGTLPLFSIIWVVLAVVTTFVKLYLQYDAQMKAHDAASPWGRARARAEQGAGQP